MKITVVGLTGIMGSGKTTIAQEMERYGYKEMKFASSLYRMATLTSQHISDDAIASHELYSLLMDVFGGAGSAPPFAVTASLVLEGMPDLAARSGLMEDVAAGRKPRKFLQATGDYFRKYSKDIFANHLRRTILTNLRTAREEYFSVLDHHGTTVISSTDESTVAYDNSSIPAPHLKIVISDVRYQNEIDAIEKTISQATSLFGPISASYNIIRLDIDKVAAARRVSLRDGLPEEVVLLSMGHGTEQIDELRGIHSSVDSALPREEVLAKVMSICTGKPESQFLPQSKDVISKAAEEFGYQDGTKLVDLSQFRKEEKNGDSD